MNRIIESVYRPFQTSDGAGVKLSRVLGNKNINQIDPFLLLDHFGSDNPEDYIGGFPMHPHRGIETVTYMLSGKVDHKDSLGNAGSVREGDVQWMTSGRGIFHEEMPTHEKSGLNGFQLWVNMPAKLKMSDPRYQDIPSAEVPVYKNENEEVMVIAGEYNGVQGAVHDIYIKPLFLDVHLEKGKQIEIPIPSTFNVFAYLYEGKAEFDNGSGVHTGPELIVFSKGENVIIKSTSSSRLLMIAGEPLNEPVVRYGPFVMNTQDEIQQTLSEIRNGTFATE